MNRPDAAELKKEFTRQTGARSKALKLYKAYVDRSNEHFYATHGSNPGYGRHLDQDYQPIHLYKYFSTSTAARTYARLRDWPTSNVEHKKGGWPGARNWVAGEDYRVMVQGGGTRMIGQNPIQDPNSSGQGYDPDHTQVPYEGILSKYGYSYSHSTPVVYPSGRRIHHTYKKGDHGVGVDQTPGGVWKWDAHKGGSGHSYGGSNAESLEKYLKGRARKGNPDDRYFKTRQGALSYATKLKRKGTIARAEHYGMGGDREWVVWVGGPMVSPGHHEAITAMAPDAQYWKDHPEEEEALRRSGGGRFRSNPESDASSMYESFHGSPSEEVVEFHEDEHYHGNLSGLGVLVELKLVTTTGYDVTLTFSDPEALIASNPGLWQRLRSIGHRTTISHVPKHSARLVSKTRHKGYDIYKAEEGGYRVPELDPESSFDTPGHAKKFIDYWKKQNPGGRHYPDELKIMGSIREGEMILQSKRSVTGRKMSPAELGAVQRAVDNSKARLAQLQAENDARYGINPGPFQSASHLVSRTGKYLDDQLGRVLNPGMGDAVLKRGTIVFFNKYNEPTSYGGVQVGGMLSGETQKIPSGMSVTLTKSMGTSKNRRYLVNTEYEGRSWWAWVDQDDLEFTHGKPQHKPNPSMDVALLCSNESGTQIYIQGGDQSVSLKSIHMDTIPVKDSMVLGEAYFVSYFTQKDFEKFRPTIFEHDIAEESDPPSPKYRKDEVHTAKNRKLVGQGSGLYPVVRLDTLNQKLYLDGGEYKIDKPLIGTSPGIEN